MNKANHILRAALAAAGLTGIVAAAALPAVAVAQDAKPPKVNAKVAKPLRAAQEAMQAKNYDEAMARVAEARAVEGQEPYDEFMVNEIAWYVLVQQKNYAEAATTLEKALASGFVPPSELAQRTKVLTQLYYQTEQYPKAIEYGNKYLASTPGDDEIAVLVTQSYYLQKDYAGARATSEKIVASSPKPSEQLLLLQLRSIYELNDRPGVIATLEQLVRHYPQTKYWEDLLNNQLFASKTDRELRLVYRLMEETNTLDKGEEYAEMAGALIQGGFPSEAKRILERAMGAGALEGDAKVRAQADLERARAGADADRKELAGADAALAAAKTGNQMVAIGKLYFSTGDYARAVTAVQQGLAKGGVSDADDANALLGVALARSNKPDEAKPAFQAIKDARMAEIGRLWQLALPSTAPAPAPATAAAPPTTGG